MAGKCGDCARDVDHCHGALVVHDDGGVECTAPNCDDIDPARHGMVMDCAGTLPGCCVAEPVAVLVAS
jgi:hypothetical protein